MKNLFLFTFFLLSIFGESFAGKVTAKLLYKYDLGHDSGSVNWKGKKFTGEHYGSIKVKGGELVFDGDQLLKGKVIVDMNSITCKDIKDPKYNTKLIRHLKSDDFFSTDKHPYSTLEIKNAYLAKGGGYEVHGNLTIKGITKPINFKAQVKHEKKHIKVVSKLEFDRTQYDIRYKSKKFFDSLGDKFIYDKVNLSVSFNVKK